MKVYYLINKELGYDNLVTIALTKQKCIEYYTDKEIIPQTDEEIEKFLKENQHIKIYGKTIYE